MSTPQFSENQFLQKLHEESQRWVDENLLSPEQRDAILRRSDVRCNDRNERSVRLDGIKENKEFPVFLRVILALGVLLVGLAVLLLISFNWKYLSGTVKLSIVGSVLAAAYAGGFVLRAAGRKIWADGTFFFAGIMYGVGIWQIGQVFNMSADLPAGLYLWAAGTFPLALILASTPLHILSVVLLAAWITASVTDLFGIFTVSFNRFIPLSTWSLPVFAALGITAGVLLQKKFTATLYIFLFGFWWIMQGISCRIDAYLAFHIAVIGIMFFALSACRFRGISNTALKRAGFLLLAGGLIAPSFNDYWYSSLIYRNYHNVNGDADFMGRVFWGFALPVIDLLILGGFALLLHRRKILTDSFRRHHVFFITAAAVFVMWFAAYFISLIGISDFKNADIAAAGMITVNVLIVYLAIVFIFSGLKRALDGRFWGGTVLLLFWTVLRYFDLFHNFGMLGTAAVFGLCGLFMLGIVYFWTTRRNKFRSETHSNEPFTESLVLLPVWAETLGSRILPFWSSVHSVSAAAVLTAVLQFAVLGAMIANEMVPHRYGTLIQVETIPVDPRHIFRGDYVVLNYDFSTINNGKIQGCEGFLQEKNSGTVYVSMKQDGDVWKAAAVSRTKPQEGIFLKGTLKWRRIIYGIESYYVQEGTGKAIEDAIRRRNRVIDRNPVIVELLVAPNGKAVIKDVKITATKN